MPSSLRLTPIELNVLSTHLGASVLQGVPDPFFEFMAIEVDLTRQFAETHLIERGLLLEQADGPPILAPSVAPMVGALAFPHSSLRLVVDEQQKRLVIWFHRTRNLAISITSSLDPCLLQTYPDEGSMIRAIVAHLWGGMASLEHIGGDTVSLDGTGGIYIYRSGVVQQEEATWDQLEAAVAELVYAARPAVQ